MKINLASWWQCGLLGAGSLACMTLGKMLEAIDEVEERMSFAEAVGFVAAPGAVGFVCGVVGWAGRGLYTRLGIAGAALAGLIVMDVYFGIIMVFVEPELLTQKFATGGLPMLILGAVLGAVIGTAIGFGVRSSRRAKEEPPPRGERYDAPRPRSERREAGKPLVDGESCALCGLPLVSRVPGVTLCEPCRRQTS